LYFIYTILFVYADGRRGLVFVTTREASNGRSLESIHDWSYDNFWWDCIPLEMGWRAE